MRPVDEGALRRLIAERVAAWCGTSPEAVPMDRPLADLGMSSRDAVALAGELSRATGQELPTTLLWETPTAEALMARLCGAGSSHASGSDAAPVARTGLPSGTAEPVAVVGVGCRLPGGVHGPDGYWRLLSEGVDAIRRVPEDRWRDFTAFPPADAHPYGGYLDDIAGFDADFFRITPREAAVMDPQQRILLEVVHEALDHAAVPAGSLAGTATGVFVGVSAPEYGQLTGADPAAVDPWAPAGGALSVAAGRLAYVLDARGPSMAVDTACSSSLVAVHHACVSLRTGESDTAIAAGVNLLLSPAVSVAFRRAGALAPDGRCKPFSASADGIGRGEGCAAVILKRLSDAERDGDRVLAVVRATAVNSDGRSNGLMAPNPAAQQALLRSAYARAGLAATHVDYVEAHGTGTPLGDPIEAGALGAVLGTDRDPDQPLLLGSVKGNLGHLESAAGIAGLVKTVLALHHDSIPPSLHCADGSSLADDRLRVVTEPEPWPRYGGTAVAGISGFGFGGTNAHVVLEEGPPGLVPARPAEEPSARLHLLSDLDAERLGDTAGRLAGWLRESAAHPADVARTLAGRTGRGPVRAAVAVRDRAELADVLEALATGRPDARVVTGDRDRVGHGTVWVFSGYGSQWPGMGRRLLAEEPAFAAAVEKIDPQLAPECGLSLYDHLSSGAGLDRLEVAQPVLFGLQVALAELWRAYGVEPAAVIGHSMGEVAAAVCAGALDVADGARVIAVRARLLSGLSGGAMAVVDLDDAELQSLERDFPGVHVAVHSSPRQKVVTGEEAAVAGLVRRLEGQGRAARAMRVVGAGHSPQVDPLLPELVDALAGIRGRRPTVPVYSTVLDDPCGDCGFGADHWAANLRRPVRLDRALASAAADGHTAFVEISPHPVLTGAVADTVPGALALATLRRDADGSQAFAGQLGALYVAGQRLPVPPGRVVDLPLPRWRHVRHWWTDGRAHTEPVTEEPPAAVAEPSSVLARLAQHIAAVTGHPPTRVAPGTALADLGLDSLMAVRVRTAVEREFGIALPLRDLFAAVTVEDAAARIRRALPREDTPLRPLRATGSRPPFFLVHAAGGPVTVYRTLAERLGDGRPVYGLERIEEARTVPEKARIYAEAIDAAHPDGPCVLGGWSFGGFVAQETARHLTAAGREVRLVVLIDSVRPLPRPGLTRADRIRAHFEGFTRHVADTYGVRLELPYDDLVAMDDDGARIDTVLRALREAADVPPAALEHQRASYLDLGIGESHRPGDYDGPVVLYRATEPAPHTVRDPAYERDDEALGWDEVCPGLEIVPVPGHHLSLLDPPHVDEIAAHLSRVLAERAP
ncbi:polyketide synthase [Streptomyces violarus]|uniref:Acyl transferase domain-containing protein/thioesterase domain-containing protein n=1 Tax=Streptomyces violarus TaxID=67380 RepID=A0A7W5EYX1_9ACTN|nr:MULTISPECIES: type I polyketide synthase [Streptomyces]MBB3073801.1 acyl transferase domain-containing protein/thioesterase domain-containing protein [Streptomyces violarus]WRT96548.1 type I polyketide synthase [Streptomyces sp. CGMCC 4.1772]GHC96413.1 polyketide synthase [Streptomyces violarus]